MGVLSDAFWILQDGYGWPVDGLSCFLRQETEDSKQSGAPAQPGAL